MKQGCSIHSDVLVRRMRKYIPSFFIALSATLLTSCGQDAPRQEAASKPMEAGVGSLLSESELPIAAERFEKGEINFAWRLQTTYNAKKDEVKASVYARSLSVQENDPDAVAIQFSLLSRLEKSKAVCEAMRLNLEVWALWKDNKLHKYSDGKRQYEQKCGQ
jgi:hypothetical protein